MSASREREERVAEYCKGRFPGPGVRVKTLDSEKARTFLVHHGREKALLKLLVQFWDEENGRMKMINEKTALEFLNARGFPWAPRLIHYEDEKKWLHTELLCMEFLKDTDKPLSRRHCELLAGCLNELHGVTSREFTVPFGDVTRKMKGTGYDFVRSYVGALARDLKAVKKSLVVKKLGCAGFLASAFSAISREVLSCKEAFRASRVFSLLHCHAVRDEERRHVLITPEGDIRLIDWESVCFGERELEFATFAYENSGLPSELKETVRRKMEEKGRLSAQKIRVYTGLLLFDDMVEDLKKTERMLACGKAAVKGRIFAVYQRQRTLLQQFLLQRALGKRRLT